jgi:hypothetical protein
MDRFKWILGTVIILGGCGFLSGMFLDWVFEVSFICYVSAVIGGLFGIILHGIPKEYD